MSFTFYNNFDWFVVPTLVMRFSLQCCKRFYCVRFLAVNIQQTNRICCGWLNVSFLILIHTQIRSLRKLPQFIYKTLFGFVVLIVLVNISYTIYITTRYNVSLLTYTTNQSNLLPIIRSGVPFSWTNTTKCYTESRLQRTWNVGCINIF